jgi:hypothetical protein
MIRGLPFHVSLSSPKPSPKRIRVVTPKRAMSQPFALLERSQRSRRGVPFHVSLSSPKPSPKRIRVVTPKRASFVRAPSDRKYSLVTPSYASISHSFKTYMPCQHHAPFVTVSQNNDDSYLIYHGSRFEHSWVLHDARLKSGLQHLSTNCT